MIAAAAASSRALRTRQSFSRIAKPALGLDAGQPLVLKDDRQRRAIAERPRECLNPRRHVVRGSIEPARQADDERDQAVLLLSKPGDLRRRTIQRVLSRPAVCTTPTGRASVPVASLTATPIRRSPTSSPAMRPTLYNSRTLCLRALRTVLSAPRVPRGPCASRAGLGRRPAHYRSDSRITT